MSFDHCLSLLSLQDKLPVGEIRETAKEYAAEGMEPGAAMAKAVAEHLAEAKREEAHIVATVREKYVASGGKLAEPKAEAPAPAEQDEGVRYSVSGESGMARVLYKDRDTILDKDGRLKVDLMDAEADLTDAEFDAREKDWQQAVHVPLSGSDTARALGKINGMQWFHGSADTSMARPGLHSAGGLFLASDRAGAQHYAGKDGRVYASSIQVNKPFFVATSDVTADMESSGQIKKLAGQGYDAIVPLDYGDLVVLKDSVLSNSPDAGARYSVDAAAPTFYSALERTLPEMSKVAGKDGTIKPEQARAWLQARQKEGKFKADELQWVGVDDWLQAQPGRVSVADIANFVRENGVQVQEVTKGDGNTDTKYSQYVLPGGENYRELLLTIPDPHRAKFNEEKKALAQSAKEDGFDAVKTGEPWYGPDEWKITNRDGDGAGKSSGATADEALAAWAMLKQGKVKGADYTSSHWDESNIVAHVRFNDRTDADGKRVLFIEELQSDWGQDGLKKGFREQQERQLDELIARRDSLTDEAERSRVQAEINVLGGKAPGVAEGPFVGDTKAWLSLGIKRMIRYAAERGYDRVAFVNGEQSADRYDLSKQVSRIEYSKNPGDDTFSFIVHGLDGAGALVSRERASVDEVANTVGKEIAEKMVANEGQDLGFRGKYERSISGSGLKVGGEGMKAFYDKIVPQTINEVLKKVGGSRAGIVHLDTPQESFAASNHYIGPEHSLDALKDALAVARKGGGNIMENPLTGKREHWAFNRSANEQDLRKLIGLMEAGAPFKEAVLHGDLASPGFAELMGGEYQLLPADQRKVDAQQQTGFDITPELRAKALAGMPLFSVAHPMAKDAAREISPLVQSLADKGAIVLHQDASTLPVKGKAPAGVQALTTSDGTIHVVANALGDNARGIILHEAFHAGTKALIGSAAWDGLNTRLGALYRQGERSSGAARAFWDAARARVETAKAKGAVSSGMEHEEFGAYAIEEYAKAPLTVRKWVDDLLGAVKAWALRRFGKQLGDVTPAQLSSLAKLALLDKAATAARERSMQPSPESMQPSFSADSSKTIEVDGQRRPIENSSGKLIAPDMHQQMAFWRWAAGTKAIDEQGRPLVLYHGTGADFAVFDESVPGAHLKMPGLYFAPDAADANNFAESSAKMAQLKQGKPFAPEGANVMPVYLSMKNPLVEDLTRSGQSGFYPASAIKEMIEYAQKKGHDGVILKGWQDGSGAVQYIVFKPEQVKSAVGNDGSFSGDTPDIRYSVAGAPSAVAEEHRSALSKMIGVPKELLKSAAFNVRMAVVPMAAGAEQAMAMAKDFANHNRRAATQWAAFDKVLKNSYSDAQLKKMWVAADQENDLRREGRTSTTEGLASLSAGERKTVELLHAYGEQLWAKAKEAGLVGADSEGVHYWTPRMAANIVADGSAEMIRQPAGEFSKEARNLRTSASSTKQRKHETTTESEAALKAKLGEDAEYVKNIRVMPMAMAQLEKAIAGRTLVNQIKAHGKLAGDELVQEFDTGDKNFTTINHPALKRWVPIRDWQSADMGKIARGGYEVRADGVYHADEKLSSYRISNGEVQQELPVLDSDGKPRLEAIPLFIRKDFAGPLKAVFATDQGAIYNGLMSLKGGVTSMIMISPLTHNLVIWGKAMPTMMSTMGWKNNLKNAGTLGMHGYFIGNRARADHALMQELTEAGLVPVSGRGMMEDVAAVHNGIKPGRSLTAKALGSVADLASPKAGEAVRRGVDAAGHFWHETLLWDRVADLQAGMAVMMRTSLMDKGLSQDTANRIASHFANRYAGMIPREAMSEVANKIANLSLFSKSFTMTNLGAYKDLIGGLPKDVQAQIKVRTLEIQKALGKGELEAETTARAELRKVQSVTRKKAAAVLVLDVAAMAAVTSLAQALWEGQDGKQIAADFRERLAALGMKMKDDPLAVLGHPLDALSSLSQTADNPHGKEDRVRAPGEDAEGNSYYVRLPVGKVGEELKQYGNLDTGMHLLRNKMSTFLRPIADLTANEDFTGKRIINPHDNIVKQVAAFGAYWVKSQLPAEDLMALGHVVKGDADHMDKLKLLGTATGLSVGRLAGGDAVAELRHANREQQADLRDVLPDVREAMRRGDQEKAQQLLEDAGQTPREAQRTMRQIEQPGRISKQSLRKFNAHADEPERARLEKMRARAQ